MGSVNRLFSSEIESDESSGHGLKIVRLKAGNRQLTG